MAAIPPPDYSRYVGLIADTALTHVRLDVAEKRFATATAAATEMRRPAEYPARNAVAVIRLGGKRETSQRHSNQAEAKPPEGLSPRYGLRHTFGQLIESIHSVFLFVGLFFN